MGSSVRGSGSCRQEAEIRPAWAGEVRSACKTFSWTESTDRCEPSTGGLSRADSEDSIKNRSMV